MIKPSQHKIVSTMIIKTTLIKLSNLKRGIPMTIWELGICREAATLMTPDELVAMTDLARLADAGDRAAYQLVRTIALDVLLTRGRARDAEKSDAV